MIIRNCAGGIVFADDCVLLLKNSKEEWIFPKGVLRQGDRPIPVAVASVAREAGVEAKMITPFGRTSYEFFSAGRQKPVRNMVVWYLMAAMEMKVMPNTEEGYLEGGFFSFTDALEMITYSQDKSLLLSAYQKYKELSP